MESQPQPIAMVTDAVLVKLFGLTVRHGYYSLSDGFCPDLSIAPTPTIAELKSKFGMAMRSHIDESRSASTSRE